MRGHWFISLGQQEHVLATIFTPLCNSRWFEL